MTDPIYLLDFRRGVVEKIEESMASRESSDHDEPESGSGFVLAALGSPPEADEE